MLRVGEGLKRPGLDTRAWVAYGTVASVRGEDDAPNFDDPNAVVISPKGIDVDVVFEHYDNHPVTCSYGTQLGEGCILTPVRSGDLVMVEIPDGDLGTVPVISKVMAGPGAQLMLNPDDRKPWFRNDRVIVTAKTVPIELRTAGGGRVLVDQDGNVVTEKTTKLGGTDADQHLLRGDAYVGDENQMLDTFKDQMTTATALCHAATTLPTALTAIQGLATMLDQMIAAIGVFRSRTGHLSDVSTTK